MTSHTLLEVHNLRKTYGKLEALKGVTFSLSSGDIFGYLGPNGSGKTTTLRIIMGLVHQDSGKVVFSRTSHQAPHINRRSTGYLPGELHLYTNMPGLAVLDYFARYRPRRPPILREQLFDVLQIDIATLRKPIKHLSHGTRQKIGLIVAMQHDPDLLLLDEPTLGLDPLVQKQFGALILELASRGRAILFSSHILSEVEHLCNRVAILREGHIVALESIDNLKAKVVRKVRVRLRNNVSVDLSHVPGVVNVMTEREEMTLWVRGDMNPVIRALAQLDIEHIALPDAEVEDVFFTYYGQRTGEETT